MDKKGLAIESLGLFYCLMVLGNYLNRKAGFELSKASFEHTELSKGESFLTHKSTEGLSRPDDLDTGNPCRYDDFNTLDMLNRIRMTPMGRI